MTPATVERKGKKENHTRKHVRTQRSHTTATKAAAVHTQTGQQEEGGSGGCFGVGVVTGKTTAQDSGGAGWTARQDYQNNTRECLPLPPRELSSKIQEIEQIKKHPSL